MNLLRRTTALILSIAAFALLTDDSGAQAPKNRGTVKVGVATSTGDAGIYIADAKGYFEEQGIKAEITGFDTAANMIAPLATGQLDVGRGGITPGLLNAIGRDIAIKIVADGSLNTAGASFEGLLIRKDLFDAGKFKDLRDLKQMKIGVSAKGAPGEFVLDSALKKVGMSTEKDVQMVVLPFPDMPAALANKSLDAAMLVEPNLTRALDMGVARLYQRDDKLVGSDQSSALLYAPRFAMERPDTAKAFMIAYLKATRLYTEAFTKKNLQAKDEVVSILIKTSNVKDRALYNRMVLSALDPNGKLDINSIRAKQDWYLARGLQKTRIDLDAAIDPSFVKYAVDLLGEYK